jgi:hypothetical protein
MDRMQRCDSVKSHDRTNKYAFPSEITLRHSKAISEGTREQVLLMLLSEALN